MEFGSSDFVVPAFYEAQHRDSIELMVHGGIGLEIVFCEFKKGGRRLDSAFLQVNESAGQLNQALIECPLGPPPRREPELLQHFVSFIEKLLIEALEIAQVARVEAVPLATSDDCGDSGALHEVEGRVVQSGRCDYMRLGVN